MADDDNLSPQDWLAKAQAATANSVGDAPLHYYLVAHDLWKDAFQKFNGFRYIQLQFVPDGALPYSVASKACRWLHDNRLKMRKLKIIAHGKPGEFYLGQQISKDNAADLVGWLKDFFDVPHNETGIELVSCNSAADEVLPYGKYSMGQYNNPSDIGIPHVGYHFLLALARAANTIVAGPLHALSKELMELQMTCRRVSPAGYQEKVVIGAKEPGA